MWYRIKKGRHWSVHGIGFVVGGGVCFEVEFDWSCRYECVDVFNQMDVNKCFGFMEGFGVHGNSCRLGWRWNRGLELVGYCYAGGVREVMSFGYVDVCVRYEVEVSIDYRANRYVFKLLGKTFTMSRGNSPLGIKMLLYPYFGGDEKAPQDIRVYVRRFPFKK